MPTIAHKQLGQSRPPTAATPVSLYSPATGVETRVAVLVICNTTGTLAKFRVFHDDNGTTYDQSTALYYDEEVAANTTVRKSPGIDMDDASGNLAVESDTNNALTFTAYGTEVS